MIPTDLIFVPLVFLTVYIAVDWYRETKVRKRLIERAQLDRNFRFKTRPRTPYSWME